MRKDQPKLAKQLRDLKRQVKILTGEKESREYMVDCLLYVITNREQELLISQIEYDRLLNNKPALTTYYATVLR